MKRNGKEGKGMHEVYKCPKIGVEKKRMITSLLKFGFAANKEVNAIICILYRRGVPVDMVQSHCMNLQVGVSQGH